MVQALLAGTKTQTRRAVTNQPEGGAIEIMHNGTSFAAYDLQDWLTQAYQGYGFQDEDQLWRCPYGQPGDRLWVRETWAPHFIWTGAKPSEIIFDGGECIFYRADNAIRGGCEQSQREPKWRPSIFMPRAASRLLLEITAVRVERLQEISEADAVAEGIEVTSKGEYINRYKHYTEGGGGLDAQHSYQTLWASINGPESWAANPWVWVVEFKVIDGKETSNA